MKLLNQDLLKELPHKAGVNKEDWGSVNPKLVILAKWVYEWAEEKKLPILFTSIIREKLPVSVSNTHAEGRAFDLSVKGWTTDDIDEILADAKLMQKNIGALVYKDGKLISVPVVFHHEIKDGVDYGAHFHFQVRA